MDHIKASLPSGILLSSAFEKLWQEIRSSKGGEAVFPIPNIVTGGHELAMSLTQVTAPFEVALSHILVTTHFPHSFKSKSLPTPL